MFYHRGKLIYLTPLLKGKAVGFEPRDEDIWDIYFGLMHLGRFDHRQHTVGKHDYYRLNV